MLVVKSFCVHVLGPGVLGGGPWVFGLLTVEHAYVACWVPSLGSRGLGTVSQGGAGWFAQGVKHSVCEVMAAGPCMAALICPQGKWSDFLW